jgi:glycosyltransferase involved in cell wall biosynthesis
LGRKKMIVVRLTRRLPTKRHPGVGLPAHNHCRYSKLVNIIVKPHENDIYLNGNFIIREILIKNKKLYKEFNNPLESKKSYLFKLLYLLLFSLKAIKVLHEVKPNVIHSYSPEFIIVAILFKLTSWKTRIFVSFHGTDLFRDSAIQLIKPLFWHIDGIIVLTSEMSDYLLSKYGLKSIVVNNGFDRDIFFDKETERCNQIVYVANIRWPKNHSFLIDVFKEIHSVRDGIKLVLVGEGELFDQVREKVKTLSLENAVIFKGYLSQKEVSDVLSRSNLFIMTSISEGFPKVILESMACGTPIVASNIANLKALIGEQYLCEVNDLECFTTKSLKLLNDYDYWQISADRFKMNALKYQWESVVKKLEEAYMNYDR